MNNYELSRLKRAAVARAWLEEKLKICKGKGTRDWSVIQQYEILYCNFATGFVGQFLNDNSSENNTKVQFVEMSVEFLSAHDCHKDGKKTGRINTDTFIIAPSTVMPEISLKEPSYLGYFESHRYLFIGYDIGFGLKVASAQSKKHLDTGCHKKLFGLDTDNDTLDSDTSDTAQQRMNRYGF